MPKKSSTAQKISQGMKFAWKPGGALRLAYEKRKRAERRALKKRSAK